MVFGPFLLVVNICWLPTGNTGTYPTRMILFICIRNPTINPKQARGVIALVMSIAILFIIPTNKSKFRGTQFYPINQVLFWTITNTVILLTWIGARPVEDPYILILELAFSRQLVTVKVWVRLRVGLCGMCDGQSGFCIGSYMIASGFRCPCDGSNSPTSSRRYSTATYAAYLSNWQLWNATLYFLSVLLIFWNAL